MLLSLVCSCVAFTSLLFVALQNSHIDSKHIPKRFLNQFVRRETDAYCNRSFDPVHAKPLEETFLDALLPGKQENIKLFYFGTQWPTTDLPVYLSEGDHNGGIRIWSTIPNNTSRLHSSSYNVQRIARRLPHHTGTGTKAQGNHSARLLSSRVFWNRKDDINKQISLLYFPSLSPVYSLFNVSYVKNDVPAYGITPSSVGQYPRNSVLGPSSTHIRVKSTRKLLYPDFLSVTAIRALARSKGYVRVCEVIPAKAPAQKRRSFVLCPWSTCSSFLNCS